LGSNVIPYIPTGVQPTQQKEWVHFSNIVKMFANQNIYYSCGFDVEDWHTSATCNEKRQCPQDSFNCTNYMEYKRAANHSLCHKAMRRTLDDGAARDGLSMAQIATRMMSFYVDDCVLSARDPVWLQSAFNVLITLFEQVGLKTNTTKTQVMTCVPGKIRESLSKEMYHDSRMGLLSSADRKHLRVNCDICGEKL
jgi:hypothetical protein